RVHARRPGGLDVPGARPRAVARRDHEGEGMRLLLSSDALPDAPLDVLGQACRRRALAGLELSVGAGQTHGLDERVCPLHQRNGSACVPEDAASVAWLRLPPSTSLVMLMIWAGAAHQMGAGLLLPEPVPDPPTAVRLALVHG